MSVLLAKTVKKLLTKSTMRWLSVSSSSYNLGDGVAIPHCRTDCPAISGAFYTLEAGIDFEAPDDLPVDLVFVLMVPIHEQTAHHRCGAGKNFLPADALEPSEGSGIG